MAMKVGPDKLYLQDENLKPFILFFQFQAELLINIVLLNLAPTCNIDHAGISNICRTLVMGAKTGIS